MVLKLFLSHCHYLSGLMCVPKMRDKGPQPSFYAARKARGAANGMHGSFALLRMTARRLKALVMVR